MYTKQSRRFIQLRKKHGLSQADLLKVLCDMIPADKNIRISIPTISSWETGRRFPSLDTLQLLAKLYDVTPDYLQCITDDPKGTVRLEDVALEKIYGKKNIKPDISTYKANEEDLQISVSQRDLHLIDGKPVFVKFKNLIHPDQWGIVNEAKNSIILKNGYINVTDESIQDILLDEPGYSKLFSNYSAVPLNYSRLITHKSSVFVEMITSDQFIQGRYNGWYKHNEDNSCLINSIGLTLPYAGVQIAYNAYPAIVR